MTTKLELVNQVLSIIGEQPEVDTTSTVGALVLTTIQTAINHAASLIRHSCFEELLDVNVTDPDWLVPAYTFPDASAQVYAVYLVQPTGLTTGDNLRKLPSSSLQGSFSYPSYSVVGQNLFISKVIKRPLDIKVYLLSTYTLPANDGDTVDLPPAVLDVVKHNAASLLSISYLDDPNQGRLQQSISDKLAFQIRQQTGANKGRTLNMGGI